MAFNFNWTPLAADTSFYERAQELLTQALNKSPKPPIIVDDIVVHEMNLGSMPPDLEILEVGDLAEDRFRGIFKMTYAGDAFLTLKTRVQANPLNTYLSARPAFGSPEPLFADSGLTIPLKITLSDIKLSAFIILVFSKQKGVTLVFRNDPLESLKVSSTFDSISFVRNYLQKEIEGQLRTLLMDELPAIIHRLSLRLLVPEYRAKEDEQLARDVDGRPEEVTTDPFASPPQDPVDKNGNVLDANQIASLSLDSSTEVQSLFSRKNLLRLAALSNSSRTLSLFSPGLRDVVFRAWAGPLERGEGAEISPYGLPLSRKHSQVVSASPTRPFSETASQASRPTLPSHNSFNGSALGRHTKPGRKRKHRVVNMRKPKIHVDDSASVSGESSYSATPSSASESGGAPISEPIIPEGHAIEIVTPPLSPHAFRRQHRGGPASIDVTPSKKLFEATPRQRCEKAPLDTSAPPMFETGPPSGLVSPAEPAFPEHLDASTATIRPKLRRYFGSWQPPNIEAGSSTGMAPAGSSLTGRFSPPVQLAAPFPYAESSPGGILEQAWMMKMAGEIARRVEEQKRADADFWASGPERHGSPPPAYTS